MANKYTITRNVLREYDEFVIEQRVNNPINIPHFRDWILEKVVIKKKKTERIKSNKLKFWEFVRLSEQEYSNLITWYSIEKVKEVVQRLNTYIGSKWDKYKSHYHTIIMWFDRSGIKRVDKLKDLQDKEKEEKQTKNLKKISFLWMIKKKKKWKKKMKALQIKLRNAK